MVAALLHNSVDAARGVRRPRRDRRRQRARPSPARPGLVLRADDGFHAGVAVSRRRAGELEAGARHSRAPRSKAVLADRAFRDGVRAELKTATTFRLFNSEWDKVHVVETARPELARHEQRSIAAIAADDGRDPLDTMLDIALADDLKTVFTAQLLNSDEDAVGRMLNHPHSIVSLSDAGAHLTFFNDAGFGLHLLGHWSRDLGAMSLAEAVRRLTSHPASVLGLRRTRHDRRRTGRRPAPVRSEDGRPRTEAPRPRPAGGRGAPHDRRRRRPRRLGQRPPGRRRRRAARRRTARRRAADRVRSLARSSRQMSAELSQEPACSAPMSDSSSCR